MREPSSDTLPGIVYRQTGLNGGPALELPTLASPGSAKRLEAADNATLRYGVNNFEVFVVGGFTARGQEMSRSPYFLFGNGAGGPHFELSESIDINSALRPCFDVCGLAPDAAFADQQRLLRVEAYLRASGARECRKTKAPRDRKRLSGAIAAGVHLYEDLTGDHV